MNKKSKLLTMLSLIVIAALLFGCAGMAAKPTEKNFKAPVVTLDSMEVAHAFGYWYYAKSVEPTKGTAGDVGAPLDLAFTFNIENPNEYPVQMEKITFDVAFEDFDVNTVGSTATQWIPAGKTNQVKVHAHFDVRQTLLSLLVTGGFKLQEKNTNAWDQLEAWWTGIPEYAVPIHVKSGSALFKADGLGKVV
ncbi:MAG: LEA type 2 family protein, partial [Proteobacteria bacterium]|nr:LEA type 2 family protein [Pseudomonadota bacterium]